MVSSERIERLTITLSFTSQQFLYELPRFRGADIQVKFPVQAAVEEPIVNFSRRFFSTQMGVG